MAVELEHEPFGTLHVGCGNDQPPGYWNVDLVDAVEPDEVHDLDDTPWPWPDASFERIIANHVIEHLADIYGALEEAARVLEPGGKLVARVPMGVNAHADPDHTWGKSGMPWTWRTPLFHCGERHWNRDCGLIVESREVSMHSHYNNSALKFMQELKWKYQMNARGPGNWCFSQPAMSGTFKVVFRKR